MQYMFSHLLITQAANFSSKGIPTAYMDADQNDELVISRIMEGKYKIIFFTPEMLLLKKSGDHYL